MRQRVTTTIFTCDACGKEYKEDKEKPYPKIRVILNADDEEGDTDFCSPCRDQIMNLLATLEAGNEKGPSNG